MALTNEDLTAVSQLLDTKLDSKLKSELQPVKEKMQSMEVEMQGMKADMQNVKHRVTALEMHLENVTDKNIALLVENCIPAAKAYMKSVAQIESMQVDIDMLKEVVAEHSEILSRIS